MKPSNDESWKVSIVSSLCILTHTSQWLKNHRLYECLVVVEIDE